MRKGMGHGLKIGLALALTVFATGCGGKTVKVEEAMGLMESMDYQGALAVLDEAAEQKENSRLIARGRGIAYLETGRYDEAVQSFLQALADSNGLVENIDYDLNYYLASAYSYAGRFQEAKEVYDAILAMRPKEKDAYYLRGNVEMELDQYNEAKADFDQAVSMDPKNYDRLFAIYEVLTLSSFDKGRLYYYMENYQKAYVELEDAKSDDKAESSLYLGKAYEATGDFNYACNVYRSYLEKHGDSAVMYNQLGVCEMKRGNYSVALEAFQAGLTLQDKSIQQILAFNEIVAYEYLGNFERAASLMENYLTMYPGDQEAAREESFLATRLVREDTQGAE